MSTFLSVKSPPRPNVRPRVPKVENDAVINLDGDCDDVTFADDDNTPIYLLTRKPTALRGSNT